MISCLSRFRLAGVALLLLFPACSTISSRIEERPTAFRALPSGDQQLVARGQLREGLSKDAAYIAWGKPDEIARGSSEGRAFETWIYFGYEQEAIPDYDIIPVHVGRHSSYRSVYRPTYISHRYPYKKVTFANGKVVAWAVSDFR